MVKPIVSVPTDDPRVVTALAFGDALAVAIVDTVTPSLCPVALFRTLAHIYRGLIAAYPEHKGVLVGQLAEMQVVLLTSVASYSGEGVLEEALANMEIKGRPC